jgi:hypothetical protein
MFSGIRSRIRHNCSAEFFPRDRALRRDVQVHPRRNGELKNYLNNSSGTCTTGSLCGRYQRDARERMLDAFLLQFSRVAVSKVLCVAHADGWVAWLRKAGESPLPLSGTMGVGN